MKIIEYFSEHNRVSMTGVWKDVYNIYVLLQIESTPQCHAKGKSWYNIKLDKFLFVNIVKTLYDQLNTPNSMSLVKELFDQLEVNKIDIEKFTLIKNTGENVQVDNVIWREYLKNSVFGALYYVLYKTREELKDPLAVEIVKRVALYKGNPNPHYFEFFEERLTDDTQSTIEDQTIESESQPEPSIPNYSEAEKKKLYQQILAFEKWLEQEAISLRDLKARNLLSSDVFLHDFALAGECLDRCKKSLGIDISNIAFDLEVTSITIDTIRYFIFEKFPCYHEIYDSYFPHPITLTPKHIEEAEIVEEVKDIATTDEEPSPEVTTTEDDTQAVILHKRKKALDMIMKCESFFKSNTQQIIQQAFNQLCEDKYAHLDDALSGQSFNTTVCRMIGVALDEKLFNTTKKRDLGRCVEDKEMRLLFPTAEKYIGEIHETPQQGLLKSWRKYLQTTK